MQFGIINTEQRTADLLDFDDIWPAAAMVGLQAGKVDFGAINRFTHIVVFEHSLFVPPAEQNYFAVNGNLYAGNAVIFACDDHGETVSLTKLPPITFFADHVAAELAIKRGEVQRPRIAVGNTIHWQWNVEKDFDRAITQR